MGRTGRLSVRRADGTGRSLAGLAPVVAVAAAPVIPAGGHVAVGGGPVSARFGPKLRQRCAQIGRLSRFGRRLGGAFAVFAHGGGGAAASRGWQRPDAVTCARPGMLPHLGVGNQVAEGSSHEQHTR